MPQKPYQLPDLPYDFNALEPVISSEIMKLHYQKHHQGYVNQLNDAIEKYHDAESKKELAAMVRLQGAIQFNGGGHLNHTLFWQSLTPTNRGGGQEPKGKLAEAINRDFGSFLAFKQKFELMTIGIRGSGWGFLVMDPEMKRLSILALSNHDLATSQGAIPLFTVDVWEHAYYLQYKNSRSDYVKAIWSILNWTNIEKNFM